MNDTLIWRDLINILPILITSVTAVIAMLMVAIKRHHALVGTVAVLGLNLALASVVWIWLGQMWDNPALQGLGWGDRIAAAFQSHQPVRLGGLLVVDGFGLFFQGLILIAALACCTLGHAYLDTYRNNREEFYLLLLIAITGGLLLCVADHMASFFIGLELLSVPTYGMLAYTHERSQSLESGIKYMVLSAGMSAAMLMGMALIYAYTGSMRFADAGLRMMMQNDIGSLSFMILGGGLIIVAMAFKLSLVPLHAWTPDVYQGAPAPASTFLATVGKVAVAVVLLRYLVTSGIMEVPGIRVTVTIMAVASILLGNLLALRQSNLKRMLAYSSIAHMGYLFAAVVVVAVSADRQLAQTGIAMLPVPVFYLMVYALISVASFGVISLMSSPYRVTSDEAQYVADYKGLFWRRPVLTSVLTVMLLALAGIPLTGGFIAKFTVILGLIPTASWGLIAAVIVGSGIGLYYYLRTMVVMFMSPPETPRVDVQPNWGVRAGGLVTLLISVLILVIGIYPSPFLALSALAIMGQ